MNTHDDGGPAFPVIGKELVSSLGQKLCPSDGYGWEVEPQPGMTIRDYFAAAALQGILAADVHDGAFEYFDGKMPHSEWVPVTAYSIADAMLAARKEGR